MKKTVQKTPVNSYKVFDGYDWKVAAKNNGGDITVLYEGHSGTEALNSILEDMFIKVPFVVVPIGDGWDEPTASDWA